MLKTTAIWLGLCSLSLAVLLALVMMTMGKRHIRVQVSVGKVFRLCAKLPFFGDYLTQIHNHLKTLSPRASRTLEATALRYWFFSLFLSLVVFAILWEALPNWSSKLCAIILWYWSFEQLMSFFLVRQQVWLLKDLIDFVGNIRMHYFDTWMVEESLYLTLQGIKNTERSLVLTQGTQILEMLESPEDERALDNYNLQAPNHYLKLLAAILYLTKEFGDSQPGEASRFAKSLNLLMQELRDEVLWRERLGYALKSLNLVIILPLFSLGPIKAWAGTSFDVMREFYAGPLGYLAENVVSCVVLISIYLMAQIQWNEGDVSVHYPGYAHGSRESRRATKVSSRAPGRSWWRDLKGLKQRGRVASSGDQNQSSDQYQGSDQVKVMLMAVLGYALITGYAWLLGLKFEGPMAKGSEVGAALTLRLEWAFGGGVAVCLAAYFSSALLERFQKYLSEISAQSEIDRFHTVILSIMHIPQMGVDDIMHWMEKFSTQFKSPIQQALLDYDSGGMKTLQTLYTQTKYIEFQKIVTQLMMAAETLTISKAFEELESEKAYYQEKKKITQERLVSRKINLGQIVGFAPTYATLIVYFMIPMIYASVIEMNRYVEMLK